MWSGAFTSDGVSTADEPDSVTRLGETSQLRSCGALTLVGPRSVYTDVHATRPCETLLLTDRSVNDGAEPRHPTPKPSVARPRACRPTVPVGRVSLSLQGVDGVGRRPSRTAGTGAYTDVRPAVTADQDRRSPTTATASADTATTNTTTTNASTGTPYGSTVRRADGRPAGENNTPTRSVATTAAAAHSAEIVFAFTGSPPARGRRWGTHLQFSCHVSLVSEPKGHSYVATDSGRDHATVSSDDG